MANHRVDPREELQAVMGTASLGLVADNTLIAVTRYAKEGRIEGRDITALTRCHSLLESARAFSGHRAAGTGRRNVVSAGAAGRAFEAVTIALHAKQGVPIEDVAVALKAIIDGVGKESEIGTVSDFCRRLGSLTLTRSLEYSGPRKRKSQGWTTTAQGF
jgi:hypothetical protein